MCWDATTGKGDWLPVVASWSSRCARVTLTQHCWRNTSSVSKQEVRQRPLTSPVYKYQPATNTLCHNVLLLQQRRPVTCEHGWRATLLRLLTVQSPGFCKLLLRNRARSRPGQSHELTGIISTVSVYVGDLRKRLCERPGRQVNSRLRLPPLLRHVGSRRK